jgi:hypothetical protein
MNRYILCLLLISVFFTGNSYAQLNNKVAAADTSKKTQPTPKKDTLIETGVAVSPSTLRYNVKPGTLQTKTVRVTNDTRKKMVFQVIFQDYGADEEGKGEVAKSKYDMYSLSKYIVVSPTLLELGPRESKTVSVTVDIPAGDSMAISMWTIMELDQVVEREKLEVPNPSKSTLGLGVKNSFGFAIHVYQNPPNVSISSVEIVDFKFSKAIEKKPNLLHMRAKNTGTGIAYTLFYLELTNLVTGKLTKLKVKQFAVFPGYQKDFDFELPANLEKGSYSAMAVLDFGNKDDLQTAEMEFKLE